MKKIFLSMAMVGALASCTTTERNVGVGAAGGAVVGGLVTGDVRGAAVGALVGGTAGALVSRSDRRSGYCIYRDRRGHRYEARCD